MSQHDEIQTLPQVQDQETLAMQNLFQRAADTIVNASKLGKEVQSLRDQLKLVLTDVERMREHIQWLEQENQTLRSQRDEAQNDLSNTKLVIDSQVADIKALQHNYNTVSADRDNARGEARMWQDEALTLEKERNELKAKVTYLKGMLTSVWDNIKNHFIEPQASKAEANSIDHQNEWSSRQTIDQGPRPYYEAAVAGSHIDQLAARTEYTPEGNVRIVDHIHHPAE